MFPLHLAALSGFSDCCRKLLSSGEPPFVLCDARQLTQLNRMTYFERSNMANMKKSKLLIGFATLISKKLYNACTVLYAGCCS